MPCEDITDILKLKIDSNDKLVKYSLTKLTCGGQVGGDDLILKWLSKFTMDEIYNLTIDDFTKAHPTDDEIIEYLLLKQFLAVKSGISMVLGHESGGKDSYCTVESISYGPNGMIVKAMINIEAITAEIKSCGRCATCVN